MPDNHHIAQLITSAHRDLDEAMHHILHAQTATPTPMTIAVIQGRLVDAAGHAITAAQEALRG